MALKKDINFKISDLIQFLKKHSLLSKESEFDNINTALSGFSSISNPKPNTVTWIRDSSAHTDELQSVVILCPSNFPLPSESESLFIFVYEPQKAFAMCIEKFALSDDVPGCVAETARIDRNCRLGTNISIGEYSVIGSDVIIGDNTEIENHVCINSGSTIGSNCKIKTGAVIGGEGFGFYRNAESTWKRFPQIGRVIINDNVEIGAYSVIDRATLDETIIGKGTKIDSHVYIAHNCIIGENNIITAKVTFAGRASTGSNVWIGPSSSVLEGCHIGDNAYIGMATAIIRPVEPNCKVVGVPGKTIEKLEKNTG